MNEPVYQRAPDILQADLGAELVALDAQRGNCFGFNEVAATVWRGLEQPRTFAELRANLLEEYEVEPDECETELRALLSELESRGLVVTHV